MRLTFCLVAATALLPSPLSAARPNILFIHMEDMGVQIPAYGDHTAWTPNLDQLAAQGVVFERVHVTAATCAASRGSLFTGLYPHQNGIMAFVHHHGFHFRQGVPTFVQALKQAGYRCGLTYKTGIEPESTVPFDFKPSYEENKLTGVDAPSLVNNSIDNFRKFLQEQPVDQPFYFQAQTPDTHKDWKRPEFIKPGSSGWPYPKIDRGKIHRLPHFGPDLVMTDPLVDDLADYYNAIQRVDWFVGNILALLEEFGHAEDTVVLFTADHGPSHLNRGKTSPYENGLRVPLIVRWPGNVAPGTRSSALVSFVDFAPTFLELAGLKTPAYLPGYSIIPVLRGEASKREYLYSAYNCHGVSEGMYWPNRTITDGRFKLIHNLNGDGQTRRVENGLVNTYSSFAKALAASPEAGLAHVAAERGVCPPRFELYDLRTDPGELEDLWGRPEVKEIEVRLKRRLDWWRTEVVLDPFADPGYLSSFNQEYAEQLARMLRKQEELGGSVKGTGWRLDWDHRIPPWDPTPYEHGLHD